MGTRVGCYRDDREQRLLVDSHADLKETNTPDKCISQCYRGGNYGHLCIISCFLFLIFLWLIKKGKKATVQQCM